MLNRVAIVLLVAALMLIFASAVTGEETAGTGDSAGTDSSASLLDSSSLSSGAPEYGEVPIDDAPGQYTAPLEGFDKQFTAPLEGIGKQFTAQTYDSAPRVRNHDNGIVVGQPKLFELRSVQQMIDSVKASLMQAGYPNTSQLFSMTGRLQGIQSNSQNLNIGVTEMPQKDGTTRGTQATSTQAVTSSASDFEARSTLAISPTDVLAEQTSLWHQLVNLQMLLDGALSDRLIPADENGAATVFGNSVKFSPRAQAIIGFQISVDPRQEYRNAVAEATITIDNRRPSRPGIGGYGDEPSLMMLLPRDKTYNSISISRDNRSFGIGAIVNIFSLGLGQDKRSEAYYVGKDTDTIALERIPGLPIDGLEKASPATQTARYRGVSFGWQFRPVFNRAGVDPGVRQVFAMLSLPASVLQEKWEGKVHVTTYWRRYDRSTGAVGKPIEGSVNEWSLDDVIVPIGSGVEEALRPHIADAGWEDAGGGNVAVTLEGSNFSLGTDVACGDVILGEKYLPLFTAKRIRFVAPASAIARGNVTLLGRYGIANLTQSTGENDDPYRGIAVLPPRFSQQDDQTTSVELTLSKVQNPARLVTDRRPVVQLDGQLFGLGEKPFTLIATDESHQTVSIRFSVPTQTIARAQELVVRDMVGPAALSVQCDMSDGSCMAHRAVVLSTGDKVSVAILGRGFRDDVKVQVGSTEVTDLKLSSSDGKATVIAFELDKETALNTKYFLVTQGEQPPMLVAFSMPASVN